MKKIITLLFLLSIPFSVVQAKKKVQGYYVTLADDTVKCTFLVPVDLLFQEPKYINLQYKIMYLDTKGEKQKFIPGQIKAFALFLQQTRITYLSVRRNIEIMPSLFSNEEHIFLRLNIDGPLRMFKYYVQRQSGGGYSPTMGFSPTVAYTDENFLLQKENGLLTQCRFLHFRKDLSKYLSDYPELSQKILNRDYVKGDIELIVKEYNQWIQQGKLSMAEKSNGF
jgi:hypothetical protein